MAAAVMPAPPQQDPYTNYNTPAFVGASKGRISRTKLVIFGSTAAFLGVILTAIWIAVGK
jgi:hypothetical protein